MEEGDELVTAVHDTERMLQLCRLLTGLDREQLQAALQRLENRQQFAEHLSKVLADAVRLGIARDQGLGEALAPVVAKGVHATVKREPGAFGKALAPAMGPAIRQSVWLMIRGLTESFERTLEQRLSLRSWKWRYEAWRSGKTFAEVVFLHTVAYRIEHVFLIHRHTGLLLQHVSFANHEAEEPELVSAMLTAIQDFAADAFQSPEGDRLESFQVGDLNLLVESGEQVILACSVRGESPQSVRLRLRETLEQIQLDYSSQLEDFDGDTVLFEPTRPELEGCLMEKRLQGQAKSGDQPRSPLRKWVIGATLALPIIALGILWYLDAREDARVEEFLAQLRKEPGVIVTQGEWVAGVYHLSGLRDPLARDPQVLATANAVDPARLESRWQSYHSLEPKFVTTRLSLVLAPPATVTMRMADSTLYLSGSANHSWIGRCRQLAAAVGVLHIDTGDLADADELGYAQAVSDIRAQRLPIADDDADSWGEQSAQLVQALERLLHHGAALGHRSTLVCTARWPTATTADYPVARQASERILSALQAALGPVLYRYDGLQFDREHPAALLTYDVVVNRAGR